MPYPVPTSKQYASNAVFIVQIALWAMLFLGDAICEAMKDIATFQHARVVTNGERNKMMSFMAVWLADPSVPALGGPGPMVVTFACKGWEHGVGPAAQHRSVCLDLSWAHLSLPSAFRLRFLTQHMYNARQQDRGL
ncbi:C35C5.3 [Symbiodinium natans]|uniref:C35C5.3 protein n=1 Tax=Symbiodinium natans TaxID=878477 RepID=A0A812NTP2_9DINO|nr:C35C5.3 [Symbiodinium natans]